MADLIANEFFEQGDMEKTQLKIKPIVSLHYGIIFCHDHNGLQTGSKSGFILSVPKHVEFHVRSSVFSPPKLPKIFVFLEIKYSAVFSSHETKSQVSGLPILLRSPASVC